MSKLQSAYLSVSTIHCPTANFSWECRDYVLAESDKDVFLYVPDMLDIPADIPLYLYYIFSYAIDHECYLIRVGGDEDIHDKLKKFDWE
jgi:hypothetical protein